MLRSRSTDRTYQVVLAEQGVQNGVCKRATSRRLYVAPLPVVTLPDTTPDPEPDNGGGNDNGNGGGHSLPPSPNPIAPFTQQPQGSHR